MNKNLLVFSLFVIVAGLAIGLYVISIFGLLLLITALAAPSRPPGQNAPPRPAQPQPQSGGRVTPRRSPSPPPPPTQSPMSEPVVPPSPTSPMASMVTPYSAPSPSPTQPFSYSPALFPWPMLSSMSTMGSTPQPAKPPQETRHVESDELVELGAMLAILKLVFG